MVGVRRKSWSEFTLEACRSLPEKVTVSAVGGGGATAGSRGRNHSTDHRKTHFAIGTRADGLRPEWRRPRLRRRYMEDDFKFFVNNKGINTEATYPYQGQTQLATPKRKRSRLPRSPDMRTFWRPWNGKVRKKARKRENCIKSISSHFASASFQVWRRQVRKSWKSRRLKLVSLFMYDNYCINVPTNDELALLKSVAMQPVFRRH
ncbi:hypothetical protein OSB04_002250 [Centaurea solstitialis]|uniref:Uncharacterized protein n=1 Tax=Centaurea solstitialis TaxID=347529 RepID=A0AA38WUS5_9ASTR|nr:hypothetical protein OSB04_002250 [Centaurea solstitialis]